MGYPPPEAVNNNELTEQQPYLDGKRKGNEKSQHMIQMEELKSHQNNQARVRKITKNETKNDGETEKFTMDKMFESKVNTEKNTRAQAKDKRCIR